MLLKKTIQYKFSIKYRTRIIKATETNKLLILTEMAKLTITFDCAP